MISCLLVRRLTTMLLVALLAFPMFVSSSDIDQVDESNSDSGMSDIYDLKDIVDPNLTNPQRGQGYGMPLDANNPIRNSYTTLSPKNKKPALSFSEQSMRAVLELGIIVSHNKSKYSIMIMNSII